MSGILKNVALVGASGNLGSRTLDAILAHNTHNVTVITRPSSTVQYPSNVTVKKGEYKDSSFLEAALEGQDILILMLGFAAGSSQEDFFQAAARAGVKHVVPSSFGADIGNDEHAQHIPFIEPKRKEHAKIESLGMRWVTFVTSNWIDYCIQYGVYNINVPKRTATLYTDSKPFVTTTMGQVAKGVANFLCLPESQIAQDFANKYVFVSSFLLTQPEIFEAVLRATKTSQSDWQIEKSTTQDLIDEGHRLIKAGDMSGHFNVIFGVAYQDGNYSEKVHNGLLGLPHEDLDAVVKQACEAAKPEGFTAASTLTLKES